jgi:hypothetical protein
MCSSLKEKSSGIFAGRQLAASADAADVTNAVAPILQLRQN